MPSATSIHPRPKDAERPPADPIGLWLAALIRASNELLDAYVIGGRATREGAAPTIVVASNLGGSTPGEVRCHIEGQLALAVAEGMWGRPAATLGEGQVDDAVRELCGQVIGYAAGEVGGQFPGVLFSPPRRISDEEAATSPPGDRAVVPTRVGALRWEVHAVLAGPTPRPAVAVRDRIRALRDADLQLLQAVRVLGVDDGAEDAFERLVKAVGSDPALSARILRRVNSAMVKPRGSRIQTLPQALLYLGTRAAKNIVFSALLSQSAGSSQPVRRCVVRHSLQVAIISRQLGLCIGLDGDECYLLGLLHDLGQLVLDRLYPEVSESNGDEEVNLLERQIQTLGITHTEAGAIVAAAWRFPESVRLVMTAHHDDAIIEHISLPPEQVRQVQLVMAADRIARRWDTGGLAAAELACDEAAAMLHKPGGLVRECLLRASEQFKEELLDDTI